MTLLPDTFLHRQFIERKIRSLPLGKPITVIEDSPLVDVVELLAANRVGCLVVLNREDLVVGVLSARDLVTRAFANGGCLLSTPASEVMTANPVTLPDYASIGRALHTMAIGQFRHIPIISRSPPGTLMLSVKELVDLIYRRVAAPNLSADDEPLVGESQLAEFFHLPVGQLISEPAPGLPESAQVGEALGVMATHRIGAVVVYSSAEQVIGIFTERDYVQRVAALGRDPTATALRSVMTTEPKTLLETDPASLAFRYFSEGGYRHLPIVNQQREVIGVVSIKSFVQALAQGIVEGLS